jgi:UBX domain-containing protein 7
MELRVVLFFWINLSLQMDSTPEGRTYTERYQVADYPHIGFIDPRTGRLLYRKEGWTQQNPLTPDSFAETAMDFCSRNSFDRPPQAPRPGGGPAPAAAGNPLKRPVNEMSEADQIKAAMRASIEDVTGVGSAIADDTIENHSDEDEVVVMDSKPEAKEAKPASIVDELMSFTVPDEPTDGYRIQIRMPDGKRAVRKFSASDSVRTIYAYIAVRRG